MFRTLFKFFDLDKNALVINLVRENLSSMFILVQEWCRYFYKAWNRGLNNLNHNNSKNVRTE